MKRIIAEIIFWIVNIVLIIMSFMTDRPLASFVTTIICSTPMNPWVLNRIQRKIDGNTFDFLYLLKWILPFFAIVFGVYGSYLFYTVFQIKSDTMYEQIENVKASMNIVMYLLFIAVLFFYRKDDKRKKYIIFGVFYTFCIILNFFSKSMIDSIVSFMNIHFANNISEKSYEMFYFSVLTPIKEAILTYIIFDVVFDEKDKKNVFLVDVLDKQTLKNEKYEIIVRK